jgi:hypothetical protein
MIIRLFYSPCVEVFGERKTMTKAQGTGRIVHEVVTRHLIGRPSSASLQKSSTRHFRPSTLVCFAHVFKVTSLLVPFLDIQHLFSCSCLLHPHTQLISSLGQRSFPLCPTLIET